MPHEYFSKKRPSWEDQRMTPADLVRQAKQQMTAREGRAREKGDIFLPSARQRTERGAQAVQSLQGLKSAADLFIKKRK